MTRLLHRAFVKPLVLLLPIALLLAACDRNESPKETRELAKDVLAELVAVRSVDDGSGASRAVAEAAAARLLANGFTKDEVLVTGQRPDVGVVIARYRGSDPAAKAVIVMAHLDVVDAKPEDWPRDPFTLTEDDTYFYGRGVADNKAGAAHLIANFIRLRQEGYAPKRGIVMVLTGDEETTGDSINWLANERRDLIDAGLALNTDAGGGVIEGGKYATFEVQASEKMYLDFAVTVRNSGGHSSQPRPDNAIYQLVGGLARLEAYAFPVQVNEVTRSMFAAAATVMEEPFAASLRAISAGQGSEEDFARVSQDAVFNALLRTTCVATRLEAGHANNALPQTARAVINCRIFPGVAAGEVEAKLREVMAVGGAEFERLNVAKPSDPSPLVPAVMEPIRSLASKHFGNVPVVATMSTGATDGLYLRNAGIPVYGVSAMFAEPGEENAHGRDEKIRKKSFYEALSYWYGLIKAFGGGE